MAVTIQKIAELSGVSRGTVDRVLHGRPNVNPMIREKVVRAAEKLGYQPPVPPKSADCRQAAILIPQWTDGHFNRQIVSGIAAHFAPEDMVGRRVIVVTNLKPAKLRGVESQGMILCAASEDDRDLDLVTLTKDLPDGTIVS